jgi:hypothetical protein
MASGVKEDYLSRCEEEINCTILTNDYGVMITKEVSYIHPSGGPGVCDEEGVTLYGMDELTGWVCRENAMYKVYKAGAGFTGFVMSTALLQPESEQREEIIKEFENSVVASFKFL